MDWNEPYSTPRRHKHWGYDALLWAMFGFVMLCWAIQATEWGQECADQCLTPTK